MDSSLFDGVQYQKYSFGNNKTKIFANVIRVNIKKEDIGIEVLKAAKNISSTTKINDIIRLHDSLDNKQTIAAVNGNFWRAYSNYPIGALAVDGKLVEMNPYKEWSSIFWDTNGKPYIDNFKLSGKVYLPDNSVIFISDINKRKDSNSIILYNSFAGIIIPPISKKDIKLVYDQLIMEKAINETFEDSTEEIIDYEQLKNELLEIQRSNSLESKLKKITLTMLNTPIINQKIRCLVTSIDTGAVKLNDNQFILSLGLIFPDYNFPSINDTISIEFKTNSQSNHLFNYAITGTPRLVRKGKASQEARYEGSRSRRFINSKLPRTAIGYNQNKDEIIIATIPSGSRTNRSTGASLQDLAIIMRNLGCYDALNLDGGGSTMMVVGGLNIENPELTDMMRKISSVVAVRLKK